MTLDPLLLNTLISTKAMKEFIFLNKLQEKNLKVSEIAFEIQGGQTSFYTAVQGKASSEREAAANYAKS